MNTQSQKEQQQKSAETIPAETIGMTDVSLGQTFEEIKFEVDEIIVPFLRRQGISQMHVFAIRLVTKNPGIIMTAIVDKLEMSTATATGVVKNLCSKKLLLRKNLEDDRRKVAVYPTTESTSLLARIKERADAVIKKFFEEHSEKQQLQPWLRFQP